MPAPKSVGAGAAAEAGTGPAPSEDEGEGEASQVSGGVRVECNQEPCVLLLLWAGLVSPILIVFSIAAGDLAGAYRNHRVCERRGEPGVGRVLDGTPSA